MNKKLAQMVLAAQHDITANGLGYSYTLETVALLVVECWHRTPRADEMHELVAEWRACRDYKAAASLASWLLAQ